MRDINFDSFFDTNVYPVENIQKDLIIKVMTITPKKRALAIKADGLVITSGKMLNCPKYLR